MNESKFSLGKLIAQTTLVKMIFFFIISLLLLLYTHDLVNSKVEMLSYAYSLLLLGISFGLLYLLSAQLLSASKELSRNEKVVVCFIWFFACITIIMSFSILYNLVNTSNQSNSIYFSVITFTTVGYGDISPEGWLAYVFCGLEAFLGLVSLSMLIASVRQVFVLEKVKLWHLFLATLFLIITPSFFYSCTGIIDTSTKEVSKDFVDALYFSTVTLTSLGYGDFYPTVASRSVVIFQAFIGYCLLGLLVSYFANKFFSPKCVAKE